MWTVLQNWLRKGLLSSPNEMLYKAILKNKTIKKSIWLGVTLKKTELTSLSNEKWKKYIESHLSYILDFYLN